MNKTSDLIPDDKNFNIGSEAGGSLIKNSFKKFGSGRSILIDKNNKIIAGNKSVEYSGIDDVQIIESDGKRLIAVKRTDIDLDTPEGREMALADNATAKANIIFDAELIEAELGEAVCEEWGVGSVLKMPGDDELIGENKNKLPIMKITFETPEQLQEAENEIAELIQRKYPKAFYSVSAGEL